MANGGCIKSFDFKNLEACKIGQLIHDRDTSSTSDNRWVKTNERALADLHHNLGIVYEYFRLYHGHDSFDGKGKTICALAHVGTKMNDAYWDPALDIIVFGDGDGNTTKGFTSALDIVAHEFTHGITQHTAGLIYDDESGALNESFSDVFGALIDDNDWIIGEAATLNGKGLRSMSDPSRCGSYSKKDSWGELERKGMPQPVRKGDYYETLRDHRGVHINSGIPNKVAFLIAEGGTHDGNAIRGIGRRATAAIYYRALAFILTPSTDFADLRDALETACRIEFPGDERKLDTVSKALKSVGL
jgi:thermolysin